MGAPWIVQAGSDRRPLTAVRRLASAPHLLVVVGLILAVLALVQTLVSLSGTDVNPEFALLLVLLAVLSALPLVFLPPTPAALVISTANLLCILPFAALTMAGVAAQLIALYRLGRTGSQVLAAVLCVPFLVLALADAAPGPDRLLLIGLAGLTPMAAWSGASQRARQEALNNTAARQVIDGALLEHTARGERARIARELHDVVAHHISMIAVQAESARLTTPGLPPAGAQRFSAIGHTARSALTEMRRLLGVLREDAETDRPETHSDRQPQPGLRQLNDLLDESRNASGTGTRLILRGSPSALDPGVELAAYRIVQEALTNVRRHAPGSAVDVELLYADETLRVRIRDNGPGPPIGPLSGGHGLLGMRERAAAVGGSVVTGPAVGGGFVVETVLPAASEFE